MLMHDMDLESGFHLLVSNSTQASFFSLIVVSCFV